MSSGLMFLLSVYVLLEGIEPLTASSAKQVLDPFVEMNCALV